MRKIIDWIYCHIIIAVVALYVFLRDEKVSFSNGGWALMLVGFIYVIIVGFIMMWSENGKAL